MKIRYITKGAVLYSPIYKLKLKYNYVGDELMENRFLPISKEDMEERGWEQCDFIIVTGDAYVDHHSFGTAVIARVLENAGYKVGIIGSTRLEYNR